MFIAGVHGGIRTPNNQALDLTPLPLGYMDIIERRHGESNPDLWIDNPLYWPLYDASLLGYFPKPYDGMLQHTPGRFSPMERMKGIEPS